MSSYPPTFLTDFEVTNKSFVKYQSYADVSWDIKCLINQESQMFCTRYIFRTDPPPLDDDILDTAFEQISYEVIPWATDILKLCLNEKTTLVGTSTNISDCGLLQVLSGDTGVSRDCAVFKAGVDTNHIINFLNSLGHSRGYITGHDQYNIDYSTIADSRLHQNSIPLQQATDSIMQLQPLEVTWVNGSTGVGMVAQDVFDVLPAMRPDFTSYAGDDYNTSYPETTAGQPIHYGLDYAKFVPYLIASLKETINRVDVLENIIANLNNS